MRSDLGRENNLVAYAPRFHPLPKKLLVLATLTDQNM